MLSQPGRRPPDRRDSRRGWHCSTCRGGRRWWQCQHQLPAIGGTACLAPQWVLACVGGAGWKLSSRNRSSSKMKQSCNVQICQPCVLANGKLHEKQGHPAGSQHHQVLQHYSIKISLQMFVLGKRKNIHRMAKPTVCKGSHSPPALTVLILCPCPYRIITTTTTPPCMDVLCFTTKYDSNTKHDQGKILWENVAQYWPVMLHYWENLSVSLTVKLYILL